MKRKLLGVLALSICVLAVGCGKIDDSKAEDATTTTTTTATTTTVTTTSGVSENTTPEVVEYIFIGDASQTHEGVELSGEQISQAEELFSYVESWDEEPCDIDSAKILKGGTFQIITNGEVEKSISVGLYSDGQYFVEFGGNGYLVNDGKIGQIYELFVEYQTEIGQTLEN